MKDLSIFYNITLITAYLNWVSWFHLVLLVAGTLVILIGCMIFLSPFLDVLRTFMSTVSFLAHLESGILGL